MKFQGRKHAFLAVVVVAGVIGGTLFSSPLPAQAATAALTVDKSVIADHTGPLRPGDEFSYSIVVGCDDGDCADTVMTDQLPPAFAGFQIVQTRLTPSGQSNTPVFTGCTTAVTADCRLTVTSTQRLTSTTTGLASGNTYAVSIQLKVPADLPATWPSNGVAERNTASATSSNATPATDSADVTVAIPITVDTAVGKTWAPSSQQFSPGAASTITTTTQNTSNVPASSLSLQDPSTATSGAAALDASNPFALVDFTGFGPVALPAGATTQQVDAYVLVGGAYQWVPGTPRGPTDVQLPAGVTPDQVAGVRVTFAGPDGSAVVAPGGAAGSVSLQVAQRATNRTTGASLVRGATTTNRVTGTSTVPDRPPVSKQATAPYAITPLSTTVSATKTISPARIPAGTTALGTIGGKNTSNGTLTSLRLADTGYFTADLAFGGFASGLAYPAGATAGSVTWQFGDGSTLVAAFDDGATPVAPAPPVGSSVTGFTLEYTGQIAAGATASAPFRIAPTLAYVPTAPGSRASSNTVDVTGSNPAGTATAQAKAPLTVFSPEIKLGLTKSLSPKTPVAPGGTVVAQLPTTTSNDSAFVDPGSIVVTDQARPGTANDFWEAFNPTAVAPTQVPAGSILRVEFTTDGSTFQQLVPPVDATGGATVFRYSIPAAQQGSIVGLRYTFTDAAGYPQGATVSPNTVFQARSTLRTSGAPTSVVDDPASVYENRATAVGTGTVEGAGTLTSPVVEADDTASIRTFSGTGTVIADKNWTDTTFARDEAAVVAQSSEQAGTRLGWGVTSTGFGSLTVSDPDANAADPSRTTFQAFDLEAIKPLTFAADPLLRWDTVTKVELFRGGAWMLYPAPNGSWMSSTGFKGANLTPTLTAAATGVRITVEPNNSARDASNDPTTPAAGSGIASSSSARHFDLLWQLRDKVRVTPDPADAWVTGKRTYNGGIAGVVSNTQAVTATPTTGAPVSKTATDTIQILDNPPAVKVLKTTQKATVVVPQPGDVDPSGYPTNDFTITASNSSVSRASFLRVSDPMPCTAETLGTCATAPGDWNVDPYAGVTAYSTANPFEKFTLTKITFALPAGQVDPDRSTVTLQRWSGTGSPTTTSLSVTAAQALPATALAEVVGVSVLYQGTDPAVSGGTIVQNASLAMTLGTQLRATLRSSGAPTTGPASVENFTSAQSYDPVLFPSGTGSTPIQSAHVPVALVQGRLGVTASKAFSPTTLLETDRAEPVTVTLGATQGASTIAPDRVSISDTDAGFWSSFRLESFAAGDVTLPAGATRVRVDVQTNGAPTWILGTPAPTAALPTTDLAAVTGIRFVFDRADGGLFSKTAPPAGYAASAVLHVRLLDELRGTNRAVPFPSTVVDDIDTNAHRTDSDLYPDADATTGAAIILDPGTFRLDVVKSPQDDLHTVVVGDSVPWTLAFTNTGTGYLTVDSLVDSLPATLQWDGVAPTYSTSAGGLLSTDVTTSFDQDARTLAFDWPAAAQRMAPGETFTITLGLVLQPGLTSGQRATNTFTVDTAQTLAACTNTSGNGQGVLAGLAPTDCGTSNYVQPVPGPALFTTKGVKGDVVDSLVAGGRNTLDPAAECVTDDEGYYRAPCAANSVVGGTDDWKLTAVNSGTVAYKTLTFVDPLPFAGDRQLATGSDRGSTYRPTFEGDPGMTFDAPAGTAITWQVTTAADVCIGRGTTSAWPTNPTCSTTPDEWSDSADFDGDWAAVTGLRAVFDFRGAAGGVLPPGGMVTSHFRTVNTPASAADATLAPTTLPVGQEFAWNQSGAVAALTSGSVISRAPVKAGVTLSGGPLEVTKVVTGSSAATDAPDSFDADVSCTVAGTTIDLGDSAVLTLNEADGYRAVVAGIPLGATCAVTEAGELGSYGEATRTVSRASVRILQAGSSTGVPADQRVTLTNTYEPGQLTLEKTARTDAVQIGKGVVYDITVSNVGITLARNFTVTDELPAGARVVDHGPTGVVSGDAAVGTGTVVWPVASLAPGDSVSFPITLEFDDPGEFVNQATSSVPSGPARFARLIVLDPCTGADAGDACSVPVKVTIDPPVTGEPTPPVTPPVTPPGTPPTGGATPPTAGGGQNGGSGTGSNPGGGSSGSGSSAGGSGLGSGLLAFTGSTPGGLVSFGVILLASGAVLLVSGRRRRRLR